jgi:hypothetical protein
MKNPVHFDNDMRVDTSMMFDMARKALIDAAKEPTDVSTYESVDFEFPDFQKSCLDYELTKKRSSALLRRNIESIEWGALPENEFRRRLSALWKQDTMIEEESDDGHPYRGMNGHVFSPCLSDNSEWSDARTPTEPDKPLIRTEQTLETIQEDCSLSDTQSELMSPPPFTKYRGRSYSEDDTYLYSRFEEDSRFFDTPKSSAFKSLNKNSPVYRERNLMGMSKCLNELQTIAEDLETRKPEDKKIDTSKAILGVSKQKRRVEKGHSESIEESFFEEEHDIEPKPREHRHKLKGVIKKLPQMLNNIISGKRRHCDNNPYDQVEKDFQEWREFVSKVKKYQEPPHNAPVSPGEKRFAVIKKASNRQL